MIKYFFALVAISTLTFFSCSKENNGLKPDKSGSDQGSPAGHYAKRDASDPGYSASISVDTANYMIESYLASINYPANDTSLRSLSFNADSLRAYLQNPEIKTIKFMLAHQPEYIQQGHFGQFAGMNPDALTVVIVGLGANNNYIYNRQQEVYEHCSPCPKFCNSAGAYIYK